MSYKAIETASRAEIRELQSERLRETVRNAYENVAYYRDELDAAGVSPDDIETVEDVEKLPFTTKSDFREEYPDGLFAVDDEAVRRIHASSGTTGKPKIVAYTEDDLELWNEVVARSLVAAGVEPGDTVQNGYGYGLFTGGLGLHYGVEELGATVIPIGGGQTQRQVELLEDLESDVLSCTPSYALYLAETAEEMGVDPRTLPVSTVIFGAEPCTDPMREEIEQRLDVTGIDIYGLSEIIGPGVSNECHEAQDGLHIWEDHFYPEVVDPATGEPLPEGEEGELVLTTLTKEALPAIRYRTGDLTTLTSEKCACGRTMVRMDNVTGRADDLIIVRGVNLYPSEIEAVVLEFDEVAPYYRIDLSREDALDRLELRVELEATFDGDRDALADRVLTRLENVLSFTPDDLELVDPGELERTEVGKVKRVYDHR
ncbi:phenylacetate--CoA ligase PaaK [Natronobacterium gregoryi]|uniref:Coenzyme F390 synthetase n=2 Tax=Natronobacterium gregoryi TaxID=44930 RepID=L0AHA9_NATGS|nr:phenylacetate--CoA ligase PaaK [Natronobacterium gregoryi]AFZ72460.1 coenzyme F390 synthetase [Natronobacterium gregoryi SP2]ELY74330.1 phenylacetate--CoA ligase [Natronobacterium gregoryi SP2]PLK21432.1 phenylacetate--CoA ligase [Natronobacterium gregoryi SP2]SFI78012.1 phenylacetate-CoA ligase [Natronobacterium gregoryi]